MVTCYDLFIENKLKQQYLCLGCCNYNGVVMKKKAQLQMGYRYQCKGLPAEGIISPPTCQFDVPLSPSAPSCEKDGSQFKSPSRQIVRLSPKIGVRPRFSPRRHYHRSKQPGSFVAQPPQPFLATANDSSFEDDLSDRSHDNKSDAESVAQVFSPPRKSTRPSPQRLLQRHINSQSRDKRCVKSIEFFSPSPLRKNRTLSQPPSLGALSNTISTNRTSHVQPMIDQVVQQLNQEREARLRVERQLQSARKEIISLREQISNSINVSSDLISRHDCYDATSKLVTEFLKNDVAIEDVVNGVIQAVSSRPHFRRSLNQVIIDNAPIFQLASQHFRQTMYEELRYKFRPWICLQQLDLAATVSFRAYDTIRMVEFAEDDNKKYRRGLLYSRHKLTSLCRQLESHGAELLPFTVSDNAVKFDVRTATQFILNSHGLWNKVLNKEHVQLAATVDGGDLSWNITQVSAGLKMVDPRALDPINGTPLFGNTGYDKVQSKHHCYPLYVIIGKDNKELYKTHLSKFFDDVNALEVEHVEGLQVAQCHDMCSLHKSLGVGGGMKVNILACYCCNRHRDDLAKPMDVRCEFCTGRGSTHPCYHTEVSDEGIIERMREEWQEHLNAWPHLNNLPFNGRSRLRSGNNDISNVVTPDRDPLHVEFVPASRMEREQQRKLFQRELLLRNMAHLNNLPTAEIRMHLHEILLVEKSFLALDYVVKAKNFDEAMIRLEQALPCLLHLENRISEALIEHLLRRAFRLREGDSSSLTELIQDIELVMNTQIFGSIGCASLWSCPLNPNGTVGKVKFANWRARKVIEDFHLLVNVCFPDDEMQLERQKWIEAQTSYTLCIKSLQQKEEFSEENVDNFQAHADNFFRQWLDLTGYDGITNYIHMLGAGHVRYFLKKWKNLNRFQNQGWEAYNGMIAAFWHHRTRKGGGKHATQRSKILPIARWILRVMLWRTGEAQRFFRSLELDDSSLEGSSDDSDSDSL